MLAIVCSYKIIQEIKLLENDVISLIQHREILIVYKEKVVIETKVEDIHCSCIKTARAEGIIIPPQTDAEDLIPNATPAVGHLVLFNYDNIFHVAAIKAYTNEGFLIVEGNKTPCQKDTRIVNFADPHIVGFWKNM